MPNTYRLNSHGMFDRRQDRNMRRVIFLSVEGTKTEVEYFGYTKNSIDFSVSFYNYHEPSIYPCL